MRVPPVLPALAAILVLALGAAAQDPDGEPGCPQSNPCEVELGLDASGIYDLSFDRFGTGDWILFSVFNDDSQEHTVTLEGHDLSFSIPAGEINDTRPLRLGSPGTYDLRDEPTGDTAVITVEAEEVFTEQDGSDGDSDTRADKSPIPAPAPALLLGILAAGAVLLRRK